jgi:hypothetical protein
MKNEQPQWVAEIMLDHRHKKELLWMIEDVKNMSKEELDFSIQKNQKEIEENKNKIEYNWQGKKIIQKQPYNQKQKITT